MAGVGRRLVVHYTQDGGIHHVDAQQCREFQEASLAPTRPNSRKCAVFNRLYLEQLPPECNDQRFVVG